MARIKVLYGVILMQIMIACTCHGLVSIRLTRVHKYIPIFTRKPSMKEPPTTLPPGKPLVISPVKNSSYCNESEIIAAISEDGRNKRSMEQWPYRCTYPSFVNQQGSYVFLYDIFKCCQRCEFPAYDNCIKNNQRAPSWRCPSEGIHCIFKCVTTHGPQKVDLRARIGRIGRIGRIQFPRLKCERLEKRPNGETCIRRLCIKMIV
ncbi:uncharacterized protein LOC124434520 [Xenia sp. Carnegie-2017]|uniref:uncharacterized protein LOC124434520 n=1 Tax=Xenia sp. Carnegie-2017 TaxID=2897299 RepID=UPI001F0354C1|nr:uncharacterized protein LOC124434520 [Xenia sp. Carnegie-2017]